MKNWPDNFAVIVITAWVGGLWAIGYLAAPALFYGLPGNRALAGELAGRMFALMAYVGMFSAFYLMIHRLARVGLTALQQSFFWIVVAMLLLTLAGHFGVQPILAQIKAQAMQGDVMQSVFRSRFMAWHGVASVAWLLQSLLGLALLFRR